MFNASRFGACNHTIFVCVGFKHLQRHQYNEYAWIILAPMKKGFRMCSYQKSVKFDTFSATKYDVKHFFLVDSFDVVDYKTGYTSWSQYCALQFTKWNLNRLTTCGITWSSTTFTTRLQSPL